MKLTTHSTILLSLALLLALFSTITSSHPTTSSSGLTARQRTVDFHKWENLFGNGPYCFFWCNNRAENKSAATTSTAASDLVTRQSTVDFHKWENLFANGPYCFFWCNKSNKTTENKSISVASSELTPRQATVDFHKWENLFGNGLFCFFWCNKSNKSKNKFSTSATSSTITAAKPNDHNSNVEKRTPLGIRIGNSVWEVRIIWQKGLLVHFWDLLLALNNSDWLTDLFTTRNTYQGHHQDHRKPNTHAKRGAHHGEHPFTESMVYTAITSTITDSSSPGGQAGATSVVVVSSQIALLPASITNPHTTIPSSLSTLLWDTSATPKSMATFTNTFTFTIPSALSTDPPRSSASSEFVASTSFADVVPTSQPTSTFSNGDAGVGRLCVGSLIGALALGVGGVLFV